MTATTLSALIGLAICLALALALFARRRAVRRGRPSTGPLAMAYSGASESFHGLRPGEIEDFRRSARDQLHSQREQWARDYNRDAGTGLPGRVGGIPRALRVKQ